MSVFANVNVGSHANDGTGTDLRDAFEIINQNFANIASGVANITVNAPVLTVAGRTGNINLTVNDVQGAGSTAYLLDLVSAANTYVDGVAASLGSTNVAVLNTQLTSLASDISALTTVVANTQADTGTNGADISYINGEIATLTGCVSSAYSELSTINSTLNNISGDLSGFNFNISALVANTTAQESEISSLRSSINGANAAIATTTANWQANTGALYDAIQLNSGVISTINSGLSATNAEIIAANAAVVGYVNAVTNNLSDEIYANAVNLTNYVNSQVGDLSNRITAANAVTATANVVMTAFVLDQVSASAVPPSTIAYIENTLTGTVNNITMLQNAINGANVAIINTNSALAQTNSNVVATNSAIVSANTAMANYVNSQVAAIDNAISGISQDHATLSATVASLFDLQTNVSVLTSNFQSVQAAEIALNNAVNGANAAIITANTAMKSYVDSATSVLQGYANSLNSAIIGANAAIVTANVAMQNYVDAKVGAVYANVGGIYDTVQTNSATVTANLASTSSNVANLRANVTTVNSNLTSLTTSTATLTSNVAGIYSNVANLISNTTTLTATVNTLNTGVTTVLANLSTGFIDIIGNIRTANWVVANSVSILNGITWANGAPYLTDTSPTGNIVFDGDNISSSDANGGMNFYSNGKIHVESFTGFNSHNPGYWVDIGNLENVNTGNLGINFSNGNNFASTIVSTFDWWDGTGIGQTNNSSTRHATYGLYRGDGIPGSGITKALITFDLAAAATKAPIQINGDGSVTTNSVYASNFYFANGSPFVSSTYSNANVQSYLTTTGIGSYSNANVSSYLTTNGIAPYSDSNVQTYLTASSITTYSNANVASYLTAQGVGGLSSRANISITTPVLDAQASANILVPAYRGYVLYAITTTANAWVNVYNSNSSASLDYGRSISTDPTPNSGVIAEVISSSTAPTYFTPAVSGYTVDGSTMVPLRVNNQSSSSQSITVTFTMLRVEA